MGTSTDGVNWVKRTWKDVYWVPDMESLALFSTVVLDKNGYSQTCSDGKMDFFKDGEHVFRAVRRGRFVPYIEIIGKAGDVIHYWQH